jgi:predicted AlkP superfamily pyrophosphatase or phosphodiesterase
MTAPGVRQRSTPARPLTSPAEQVLPAYGSASLVDLLPSIGAHLGVPGCDDDVLGLPAAERFVVVLVDGLGWNLLRRNAREVPYLSSLLGDGRAITVGVPSTTATSLTSLGTGLVPAQHGIVGFTSRVPATGEILNALTWESEPDPRAYQAKPTIFERAAAAGISVSSVALQRFQGTGLTEAGLRGADFVPYSESTPAETRIRLTAAAAQRGRRSIVYAYDRELDHRGHSHGCESRAWREGLIAADAFCQQLRQTLPTEVRLIVTADHGMLDIRPGHRIIAEDDPQLMAGVSALAGEPRFRHVYVDRDRPGRVADRWRDRLGSRAWVLDRDQAIEEDWFGSVDPQLLQRYGHVLVAMREDWAVMTRQLPRELTLIGMHGSLTPAEMLVPLLLD